MRVLDAEAMREVDRRAIEELGIPGMVLMENAALGVVDALTEAYPEASEAVIFCGPGNNGGDGLAVGRHLATRGFGVTLYLAAGVPAGDAGLQLSICRKAGLTPVNLDDCGRESALARAGTADVVVDALFGTGLTRPLAGDLARLVEGCNRLAVPRVAVDLPSGLDASREEPIGPHVVANLTVTFAAPKVAHVFTPAALASGEVVVADLGFPRRLVDEAPGDLRLLEAEELAACVTVSRRLDAHKGDFGHVLVVGGSIGKSGAAALAARAALRAGAGLVTVAAPEPVVAVVESISIETMTTPLPVTGDGGLATDAEDALAAALAEKSAWAMGPGMGEAAGTRDVVRRAVGLSSAPLVLDADGLNAFAGAPQLLAERQGGTILTPHPGELARLLGTTSREIVADRLGAARRAADAMASIVVLKGHRTLIADPRGGVFVNPTGNPGMATAGTGDVLTGLVVGFLAQGFDSLAAAQLGVFVHGAAGDLAAGELGETSLTAGDLLERIPPALSRLADGG